MRARATARYLYYAKNKKPNKIYKINYYRMKNIKRAKSAKNTKF